MNYMNNSGGLACILIKFTGRMLSVLISAEALLYGKHPLPVGLLSRFDSGRACTSSRSSESCIAAIFIRSSIDILILASTAEKLAQDAQQGAYTCEGQLATGEDPRSKRSVVTFRSTIRNGGACE